MPFYTDIAGYMKPGYPEPFANVGRAGNAYVYVGAQSTLTATAPAALIGTVWADGYTVETAQFYPFKNFSANGELHITTGVYAVPSFSTTLEKTYTELQWHPVDRPLEVNPDFLAGGDYDLTGNDTDGKPCWQHILGWRLEQAADLKANFQYQLIVNGALGDTIYTVPDGGNARAFLKLFLAGQETFVDYFPVWFKYSIYTGSASPTASTIGNKVSAPSGAPTNASGGAFEWVKSGDHIVQQGVTMRWRRTEEWTGYTKVYADAAHVYPPS